MKFCRTSQYEQIKLKVNRNNDNVKNENNPSGLMLDLTQVDRKKGHAIYL